ncbi:hypothetical protein ES705_20525 [subsurface metagenome]
MKTASKIIIVVLAAISFYPAKAQILVDFELENTGTQHTGEVWESKGFINVSWTNGSKRTSVAENYAHSGSKSLQVFYPRGKYGPGETGHQAPCKLEAREEYYVSYWLRFSNNFSWGSDNEGGKLPGLSGGERCSGGAICDGTNGFTARFMWRKDGKAVLYLYHLDKPGKYGEDYDLINPEKETIYFPKGEWVHIIERVKINSGSNKDGEVQVWFNGEEVLHIDNLRFVLNGDKVDVFYFSTFHGGNDDTWSPQNDSYIWFDDIVVSADRNDVF